MLYVFLLSSLLRCLIFLSPPRPPKDTIVWNPTRFPSSLFESFFFSSQAPAFLPPPDDVTFTRSRSPSCPPVGLPFRYPQTCIFSPLLLFLNNLLLPPPRKPTVLFLLGHSILDSFAVFNSPQQRNFFLPSPLLCMYFFARSRNTPGSFCLFILLPKCSAHFPPLSPDRTYEKVLCPETTNE